MIIGEDMEEIINPIRLIITMFELVFVFLSPDDGVSWIMEEERETRFYPLRPQPQSLSPGSDWRWAAKTTTTNWPSSHETKLLDHPFFEK